MHKATNDGVQKFINELELVDPLKFNLLSKVRSMIFSMYPQAEEKYMYGGLIFSLDSKMFGGLFSYKDHISLEFSLGYLMKDPDGHLEGKGKYRRHLKFRQSEDLEIKRVKFYIKQAV